MKTIYFNPRAAYECPVTRMIEIRTRNSVMLLGSNNATQSTTPDLEETDLSNIWG